MPTLRDIRNRITAVEKTQKITRAMYLVSAAKMSRAQAAIKRARPYAEKLRSVMASVSAGVDPDAHPLLEPRKEVKKLDVVVFASNRGLCGAYNSNVVRHAERLIRARRSEVESVSIIAVGGRVEEYFRRRGLGDMPRVFDEFKTITPSDAAVVADYLTRRYRTGESDETVLVYATFVSALTQRPGEEQLLPLQPEPSTPVAITQYEVEPNAAELLALLVPQAVEFNVFRALLENQAGEHAARMTAMDSATRNTEDLTQSLSIQFNKARQAAITAELVEIVSGAEAL